MFCGMNGKCTYGCACMTDRWKNEKIKNLGFLTLQITIGDERERVSSAPKSLSIWLSLSGLRSTKSVTEHANKWMINRICLLKKYHTGGEAPYGCTPWKRPTRVAVRNQKAWHEEEALLGIGIPAASFHFSSFTISSNFPPGVNGAFSFLISRFTVGSARKGGKTFESKAPKHKHSPHTSRSWKIHNFIHVELFSRLRSYQLLSWKCFLRTPKAFIHSEARF